MKYLVTAAVKLGTDSGVQMMMLFQQVEKKKLIPRIDMKWLNGVFVIQSSGHTPQCYIGIPDDRRNER